MLKVQRSKTLKSRSTKVFPVGGGWEAARKAQEFEESSVKESKTGTSLFERLLSKKIADLEGDGIEIRRRQPPMPVTGRKKQNGVKDWSRCQDGYWWQRI